MQPSDENLKSQPFLNPEKLLIPVIACALFISSCSLFDGKIGGGRDSYVGTVSFGFEVSSFRPCGGSEQWWFTGGEVLVDLQAMYNDLGVNWYEPVYAELRGEPGGRGEFGHLGAYQREFRISDILEVRLLDDGECSR